MKTTIKITAIVLSIIMLIIVLAGCNKSDLLINTDYSEYIFDTARNQYIATGRKLRINEGSNSFTMSFANYSSITGSLEIEKDINGIILRVENEAFAPFKAAYVSYLTEAYADTHSEETIQAILEQIKVQEQMYYRGKHIFSSRAIQLVKAISEDDKNVSYAIFEGIYDSIKDADIQYLFRNGMLYTIQNGKTSENAYGTYTINESYITITRIDAAGEPLYKEGSLIQINYLYTTITYPKDFTINVDVDDEDYNKMINATAKLMAGKTIAVLTNTFYLAD